MAEGAEKIAIGERKEPIGHGLAKQMLCNNTHTPSEQARGVLEGLP